jgi:hypothetical protein
MSILERLKKNLSSEQYAAVVDALGDDFDFDLVPRTRLNKVIGQRNALREQLASGLQTENLEDESDDESPKAKKTSSESNPKPKTFTQEELDEQVTSRENALKLRYAVRQHLKDAGALDTDLILNSGNLLDLTKLGIENDKVTGDLEDQIKALKESKSFLFNAESKQKDKKEGAPAGTGKGTEDNDNLNDSVIDAKLNEIFNFGAIEGKEA